MNRITTWMMVLLMCIGGTISAQTADEMAREKVVNEILDDMSLTEKIGQLYIVSFSSRQTPERLAQIEEYIRDYELGGLILMYSDLQAAADLMNDWIERPKVPLLMTIDAEWGLSMRFDDVVKFPQQMQLGSLSSPELVYEMGLQVGEQLRRFGFQVNYAPVVDVNNNPNNPVINVRSFGEDPERVTDYAAAYVRGMQDAGMAVSLKHFPGHGDTSVDSHHDLPVLNFDRARLDSIELYPFRELIRRENIEMVMLGHLNVPALDSTGTPSSLSKPMVTGLLKEEMGFDGIVITDALGMKGVSNHLAPEEIPLAAFEAGVDIMLMPSDVPGSIRQLKKAVRRGRISREDLDERVRKVLRLKYDLGLLPLDQPRMKVTKASLLQELNKREYKDLVRRIGEETLILFEKGQQQKTAAAFPLQNKKVAYVGFHPADQAEQAFLGEALSAYTEVDSFLLPATATLEEFQALKDRLETEYQTVVIGLHHTHRNPQRAFGMNDWQVGALDAWMAETERPQLVVAFFGIPYGYTLFQNTGMLDAFVIAHMNTDYNNAAVARLLAGEIEAKGVLPVTLSGVEVVNVEAVPDGDAFIDNLE